MLGDARSGPLTNADAVDELPQAPRSRPNRAAAEEFSANEPLRCAGTFKSVKITRMRRGQWNPAAAPKTPEGN